MPGGGVPGYRILLSVNIDFVAALREARGGNEPDPVACAVICREGGCDGITVHLREDRRHVRDKDVIGIKEAVRGKLNLKIALSEEMIAIAKRIVPSQITIVPEKRKEGITEDRLDVLRESVRIKNAVESFHDKGILVCLFVEPDIETIDLSKECAVDLIEINTAKYCDSTDKSEIDGEINRIYAVADHAAKVGMKISAGHGITYKNIEPLLNTRGLTEVNIGHSIISRSVVVGLSKAVQEMVEIIEY